MYGVRVIKPKMVRYEDSNIGVPYRDYLILVNVIQISCIVIYYYYLKTNIVMDFVHATVHGTTTCSEHST